MAEEKNTENMEIKEEPIYKERKRLLFFGLPWTFTKYTLTDDMLTIQEQFGHLKGIKFVYMGDEVIGTVPLVAAEDVEQSDLLSGLKSFSNMTHSFWFKFIVITIFILIALYIALMIIRNYNHRK